MGGGAPTGNACLIGRWVNKAVGCHPIRSLASARRMEFDKINDLAPPLGVHKYEAMGQEYKLKDVKENTPEQIDRAAELLREYFPVVVVN